ncbi:MAG: O-antigen polymerase [Acidobacteria bacterium OLB17]|nr:MAG: O-antigen polymerase [Acidobacteria bacterium OLB17]MCZ2389665.1 O-antigen ligase family protein [Acidobacteriota bacterium]
MTSLSDKFGRLDANIFWFAIVCVLMIPIINVAAYLDTFIHPWRPEMLSAIVLCGFCIWAAFSKAFRRSLGSLPRGELILIVAPMAAFVIWSGLSAFWAESRSSVLHHTTLWAEYIGFYLLFRHFLRTRESHDRMMWFVLVFVALITIPPIAEFQFAGLSFGLTETLAARYAKYTELLDTLVPLIVAFAVTRKGISRIAAIGGVVGIGILNAASLRRAGIGIFAISIVGFCLLVFLLPVFRRFRKQTVVLVAAVVFFVGISTVLVSTATGREPFSARISTELAEISLQIRPFLNEVSYEMFRSHPITGIGADNYGILFNQYRTQYGARNPGDIGLSLFESQLAERAHNEYVQIAAELGIVGAAIFAWFLIGIFVCGLYVLRRRFRVPLMTASAFIGLAAFLSSSVVTSYSFRISQNGIAFFLVLAVAVGGTIGRRKPKGTDDRQLSQATYMLPLAAIFIASALMVWYCGYRVYAIQAAVSSSSAGTLDEKIAGVDKAIKIDPENANLDAGVAKMLMAKGEFARAIPYLRRTIDKGRSTSIDYSYLATAQVVSGDLAASEATIREALRPYPRSVFLHVRLAAILESEGRSEGSASEMKIARSLNEKQAAVWWNFITLGAVKASKISFDEHLPVLMDLAPRAAVYAIKDEREALHPEERVKVPGLDPAFDGAD